MGNLLVTAAAETTMVDAAAIESMLAVIKAGVAGVFEIANSGFNFLMGNALTAFVICVGFGFTAFGMFRSAIKTAKRA